MLGPLGVKEVHWGASREHRYFGQQGIGGIRGSIWLSGGIGGALEVAGGLGA